MSDVTARFLPIHGDEPIDVTVIGDDLEIVSTLATDYTYVSVKDWPALKEFIDAFLAKHAEAK